MFDSHKTTMIRMPCGEETMIMLSRFHRIPKSDGRTDGQTMKYHCCDAGMVKRSSPVIRVVSRLRSDRTAEHCSPPSVDETTAGSLSRRPTLRRRPSSASSLRRLLGWSDEFQDGQNTPVVGEARNRCSGRQPDVGGALNIVSIESLRCRDSNTIDKP